MLIVHLISTQSAQFTVLARYGYLKQLALELMKYLGNYLKINLKSVFFQMLTIMMTPWQISFLPLIDIE